MKIGFISLGCPKNLVDSEVMLGLTEGAGHEVTTEASEADVLVVNTCAFIDSAKQESVDTILEMARHKETGACKRLVVTGCLAERYRDELRDQIPEIDAVLGTGEVPDIVQAVNGRAASAAAPAQFYRAHHPALVARTFERQVPAPSSVGARHSPASGAHTLERQVPTYIYDATTPRTLMTPKHYAFVKLAEGCDYNCAFCIIPQLRGKYRSRSADSVVQEARALADRGVRELILISQDTSFYGIDRRERGALPRLLRELDTIDGLEWIRLLYLYPTTITDEMLDAMAECDKVCKYIDLPLQHASDAVLKRMRRPGTRRSYHALLDRIRARVPNVALRTTFIVGFPGETEDDMKELADFVGQVRFDHVGVFTYSHEEGTPAYGLADDVPARIKTQRRAVLMAAQKRLNRRRLRGRQGERVRVLVDGRHPDHDLVLRGRLACQAPEIDAAVCLTDCDMDAVHAGDFVDAVVVGAGDYDLIARPVPV
jgi:ribosomal protein S12 methylthiotransferase